MGHKQKLVKTFDSYLIRGTFGRRPLTGEGVDSNLNGQMPLKIKKIKSQSCLNCLC